MHSCLVIHSVRVLDLFHVSSYCEPLSLQENAFLWRTSLYLAASASAEFFADIALCPMEAIKVRIQTQPGWANTLQEGVPKHHAGEGLMG